MFKFSSRTVIGFSFVMCRSSVNWVTEPGIMTTVAEWPLVQHVAVSGIMTTVAEWSLVQQVAVSGIMTTVEEWFLVPLVTDDEDGN